MAESERDLEAERAALEELLEGPLPDRTVLRQRLGGWRPEDLAELLERLSEEATLAVFQSLPDDETRAQVLAETDAASRAVLVQSLPRTEVAEVIAAMEPDDVTDLIEEQSGAARVELLGTLTPESARDVQDLLQYSPESAGGIMTPEYVSVHPEQTTQEVLELLQRSIDSEIVSYVYVVDRADRLLGVASIRDLIVARPEQAIGEVMQSEVIAARVSDDQEEVARQASKYNLSSIPVVDAAGRMVGIATIDDIIDVMQEEADEDIYRFGGVPGGTTAQQSLFRRFLARIPWLFFSLCSGIIIGHMQLNEGLTGPGEPLLLLVVFTPLVIGIAGGVGTQSSTLIARGLATGQVQLRHGLAVISQEFVIGLGISLTMALLVLGLILGMSWLGYLPLHAQLPLAVSVGLCGGVMLATVSGAAIPLACQRLRIDPALVAGPFITSLNDLVGSFCYLWLARWVLT